MDMERERATLESLVESHQRRVNHLRERIDRSARELRTHEVIRSISENSSLPDAMRSLAELET